VSETKLLLDIMEDIVKDPLSPKNVKKVITESIKTIQETKTELNVQLSSIVYNIERLTEDTNLSSYTRIKLFNLLSSIEAMKKWNVDIH